MSYSNRFITEMLATTAATSVGNSKQPAAFLCCPAVMLLSQRGLLYYRSIWENVSHAHSRLAAQPFGEPNSTVCIVFLMARHAICQCLAQKDIKAKKTQNLAFYVKLLHINTKIKFAVFPPL